MCSISGIISSDKQSRAAVERMVAALNHRGPDDRGISDCGLRIADFKSEIDKSRTKFNVILGNTRLAIIDLSTAGHQPMRDDGLTITYNGETYNFESIRREIGNEFGDWRSHTDTEVVLRAYRKWGIQSFARLRGMFALAIWDEARSELILARDPYGIKPLYYATWSDSSETDANAESTVSGFAFASEVRALLASGFVPKRLSAAGVSSYLESGSVQAPLTIVQGIRSLMPGTYLRIMVAADGLKLEEASYTDSKIAGENGHSLPPVIEEIPRSRAIAVKLLREKLRNSVQAHLVSDVPLGVFLSGGMDSSALVALMSEVSSEPPKTFSVVFDEKQFSEAPHSQLVAKRFKTDHQEVHLTEERLLEMLPQGIASLDQPTMDGINTYVVSKAVKDAGITVALSGLGGDELFAGYATFRRALRMQAVSGLAKRLLRSASGIGAAALNGSVQRRKFWQLAASDGSTHAVYSVTRQLFARHEANRIADCGLTVADSKSEVRNTKSAIDIVNTVSRLELTGYMANTLLRDTDCMSMAHSLEVRVPFVDVEVVDYVLSLPGEWKVNLRQPKPFLADTVEDLFPAGFFARPKMGFTLPFEKWMRSRLREEISSVLENEGMVSRAGLRRNEVAAIWRRFLSAPKPVGWSRPWALFVLARWCEFNGIVN